MHIFDLVMFYAYLPNPFAQAQGQFEAEFNIFEFRVFLLLD